MAELADPRPCLRLAAGGPRRLPLPEEHKTEDGHLGK